MHDLEIVRGRFLPGVGQKDHDLGALLALARPVDDPHGIGGARVLDRVALAVLGPVVRAREDELLGLGGISCAAGLAGRAVEDSVVVPEPLDLGLEMIVGENREASVADRAVAQVRPAPDRALAAHSWGSFSYAKTRDTRLCLCSAPASL